MIVYGLILIVILQRLIEVIIAKKNEQWMKKQGGYEVGKSHYRYMVMLHMLFFCSLLLEVSLTPPQFYMWSLIPLSLFLVAQICRGWALSSLGRFWNTRIIVLPGAKVKVKGPYRFIRHPNYLVVVIEIMMLPLLFQAYVTMILFTILNGWILSVRIREEEQALRGVTNYENAFSNKKRFLPIIDD
ncbi:isoprenylcysteine carboxyl methyltransferase family protein [Bacillus sp. JCM 19034]|uniref:isoprenylcysteine carboxyl methyltransferase family protein n=1 Tax=Bacillus sp. JCM 19034 TaxID=1481928 RepID=UPI0007838516|nr:isoprenylcysteine carboxyl methyltransferase family protein [Bacillus sp. JCM 19034]